MLHRATGSREGCRRLAGAALHARVAGRHPGALIMSCHTLSYYRIASALVAQMPLAAKNDNEEGRGLGILANRYFSRSLFVLLVPFALAGCDQLAVLSPAGPIGSANRTILLDALVIMLAIVIPTLLAILAVACWFRASN